MGNADTGSIVILAVLCTIVIFIVASIWISWKREKPFMNLTAEEELGEFDELDRP